MRQAEPGLSNNDRKLLDEYRGKGLCHAREVNRAHILAALDQKVPKALICQILGGGSDRDLPNTDSPPGGRAGAILGESYTLGNSHPASGSKALTD